MASPRTVHGRTSIRGPALRDESPTAADGRRSAFRHPEKSWIPASAGMTSRMGTATSPSGANEKGGEAAAIVDALTRFSTWMCDETVPASPRIGGHWPPYRFQATWKMDPGLRRDDGWLVTGVRCHEK